MKKLPAFLLAFLVCLAGASVWFYLHKEGQAESAIKKQLTALGLDVTELKVSGCGFGACSVSALRIGADELKLVNAAAQYSAGSLLEGSIDSLRIDSLFVRAQRAGGAWRIGGYTVNPGEKEAPAQPGVIPAMPLRALSINTLTLVLEDGKVRHTVLLNGLEMTSSAPGRQHLRIASIVHDAKMPAIIGLGLEMDAALADNKLQFSGAVKDVHNKGLNVVFSGSWNADTQAMQLSGELKALSFDTGVLQPQDLLPLLAGVATQVKGQVAAKIAYAKTGDAAAQQSAEVTLRQVSANLSGMAVSGAEGALHFTSFSPLLTGGKQSIEVARLEAGVPLLGGTIQFEMTKSGSVTLFPMKWDWSGGSLVTDRMDINLSAPFSEQVCLHVRQIDLNSLLALVLDKGVEAQGRLDGTIPIRMVNGNIIIDQASLMATAPGKVVYRPADSTIAQSGGQQTELLMKALENFQYKLLSMSVNSREDGTSVIGLKVTGHNPELYDGKSIEMNVTLQGRLEEIIKQNVDAYNLPSQLEKQLQEKTQ